MPFKCVLTGESLSTWVARERLFSVVRVAMALQIVLAIEGQSAHIAGERARGGSGILHGNISDRGLLHKRILRLGVVVRHSVRLRPVGIGGPMIAIVVKLMVVRDGGCRLPGGI